MRSEFKKRWGYIVLCVLISAVSFLFLSFIHVVKSRDFGFPVDYFRYEHLYDMHISEEGFRFLNGTIMFMIVNIIMLFFLSFIFYNIDPKYMHESGYWRFAKNARFIKVLYIIFRLLLLICSVVSLIGMCLYSAYVYQWQTIYATISLTTGFYLLFLFHIVIVCLSLYGTIKLLKIKLPRSRIKTIRFYAEKIVHDDQMIEFEETWFNDFLSVLEPDDIFHLFQLVVYEKSLAGTFTNDYETMAKPFVLVHPKNISFYLELPKEFFREGRRFIAEDLADAIDDML